MHPFKLTLAYMMLACCFGFAPGPRHARRARLAAPVSREAESNAASEPLRIAVIRSPWLNQIGQGTQVETLLTSWFGAPHVIDLPGSEAASNDADLACLLRDDGAPRFSVLVVPGGNDRKLWRSVADAPRARAHLREFVARGGGYVGICAGMCLASRGYWDVEGRLPAARAERERTEFAHFPGLFPAELLNLHRLRRVGLAWNDGLAPSHPMRAALPADGAELRGARFNDGNAVDAPPPPGTELLLRYTRDEPWGGVETDSHGAVDVDPALHGSLGGRWASVAYVDPENPTAGRLCLDGWHPESVHTPHCHAWLRAAVGYAGLRWSEVHSGAVEGAGADTGREVV